MASIRDNTDSKSLSTFIVKHESLLGVGFGKSRVQRRQNHRYSEGVMQRGPGVKTKHLLVRCCEKGYQRMQNLAENCWCRRWVIGAMQDARLHCLGGKHLVGEIQCDDSGFWSKNSIAEDGLGGLWVTLG